VRAAPARIVALVLLAAGPVSGAGSLAPRLADAVDLGRAAPARVRHVVVGVAPRDRAGLEAFLADVQDPASPRHGRFLTADAATAAFGPTAEDEAAVVAHLEASGLTVDERWPNRLLVAASGPTGAVERAFGVEVHDVALDGARHFAAMAEPSLPDPIAARVTGVLGLDDLTPVRSHARPRAALGRDCCHFAPADVAAFYDVPAQPDGTGVTIAVAGVYPAKDTDLAAYDAQWALPALPAGSGQVCTGRRRAPGCRYGRRHSLEASLDLELGHGLAPGARIINYMAATRSLAALARMYERIVSDGTADVVMTSWGTCEVDTPRAAVQMADDVIASANAIGQSWFAASGDTGSEDCRGDPTGHHRATSVDQPASSPHVVGVGGTTPVCAGGLVPGDPACAGYGGESGWPNSGGGASIVFAHPAFQAGCGVPASAPRLVPDVALAADPTPGNYVLDGGRWFAIGGTSAAVSTWGALFARLVAHAGGRVGNPNARFYARCGTAAFHDVTIGSNAGFDAGPGWDAVTGLGTPDVAALLAGF